MGVSMEWLDFFEGKAGKWKGGGRRVRRLESSMGSLGTPWGEGVLANVVGVFGRRSVLKNLFLP